MQKTIIFLLMVIFFSCERIIEVQDESVLVKINDDFTREIAELWAIESVKANNKEDDYIFADDFQRADATSLGTSSSGGLWIDELSYPDRLGISNGIAVPQDNEAKCYLSMGGTTNYEITVLLGAQTNATTWRTYMILKRLTSGRYISITPKEMLIVNTSQSPITKTVVGQLTSIKYYLNKINEFKIRVEGSRTRAYLNGLIIFDKTLEEMSYLSEEDIALYIASDVIGIRKSDQDGDILGITVKAIT